MRHLANKVRDEAEVTFCGESITVRALTTGEIRNFQQFVDKAKDDKKLDESSKVMAIQRELIRRTVAGAEEMTDEEFDSFPLKALANLTKDIMTHNGMQASDEGNEPS